MKNNYLNTLLFVLLISINVSGQQVSQDSVQALKVQKQELELSKKLNDSKTQLAKLENELSVKLQDAQKADAEAQAAANENKLMAESLKNEPQNKTIAKKAGKAARQAEHAAKTARKTNDDVTGLKKDIEDLRSKVAEDQIKLSTATTNTASSVAAVSQGAKIAQSTELTSQANKSAGNTPQAQKTAPQASDELTKTKSENEVLRAKITENELRQNQTATNTASSAKASSEAAKNDTINRSQPDLGNKSDGGAQQAEQAAKKANDELIESRRQNEALRNIIAENERKQVQLAAVNTGSSVTAYAEMPKTNSVPVDYKIMGTDSSMVQVLPGDVLNKVVESTFKNYPQQTGQPNIIINNIIIPSDYNQNKKQELQKVVPGDNFADRSEYEEFKAWQKQRQSQQLATQSGKNENVSAPAAAYEQGFADAVSVSDKRLTFKERFGERPKRNSGLWVIPAVGIHASNFTADFKKGRFKGRAGWNAGVDFRIHAKRFFIQPGVHYFNSSMKVVREDSISDAKLLDGPRIHALRVPLMVGLYLTKADKGFFKMNVKGGATGSYIIQVDKSDLAQFQKSNIEDYSYGLNAGIGLEFGLLTLDVSHEWGMSSVFKEGNAKSNILRATLGLKL